MKRAPFKIFNTMDLIGTGIPYYLAKRCLGFAKRPKFDLLYEDAPLKTIRIDTLAQPKIGQHVLFSAGTTDQKMFLKTRVEPKDFVGDLTKIVSHMMQSGAENIYLIEPFPDSRMGQNDIKAWQLYRSIRKAYATVGNLSPKIKMLNFDSLIMKRRNAEYDIFDRSGDKKRVNLHLFSNAFALTHNCTVTPSVPVMSKIFEKIKAIAGKLNPIAKIQTISAAKSPVVLQEGTRAVRILPKDEHLDSPVKDWPFQKYPLAEKAIEKIKPRGLKLVKELKSQGGEMPINDETVTLEIVFSVGNKKYTGLVDTGADHSVMRSEFGQQLLEELGQKATKYTLMSNMELTVANGQTLTLDSALGIEIVVKPGFSLIINFILVPDLTDRVIFGNDVLAALGAQIGYSPPCVKFEGDEGLVPVEFIVHTRRSEDPLPIEARKIINKINALGHRDGILLVKTQHDFVDINERDAVINKLRKALVPGVEGGSLTPQQAELVVEKLSAYAPMWLEQNPTYTRELVRLPVRAHAPMKPRRYSLPQEKMALARSTISEWHRRGWIVRGESEYIHPLALVAKKNGKTRVCIDATGLNQVLEYANNNPPKIESLLFEPNVGKIYSCLDFREGFMQIQLHPDSHKLLAFEFEGQVYLMTRLAFGTSVSSSIFNRCARTVIYRDEIWHPEIRVYVDDVKIESPSFENHLKNVLTVVDRVSSAGMALSLDKIVLFQPSLKYLGFKLERGLVVKGDKYKLFFEEFYLKHVDDGQVKFKNKKEVQRLLGFVNWFGLFLPEHTALVEPFQSLLKKNPPYVIDNVQTLKKVEEAIKLKIVLNQPLSDLPFSLFVQASEKFISGCVYQRDSQGQPLITTMVNHRLPDLVLVKDKGLQKLYALYYILKRYKDVLFGRLIKVNKELATILSRHRDSIYLSPVLGKWLSLLNCFAIKFDEGDNKEPEKLIEFLEKYNLLGPREQPDEADNWGSRKEPSCPVGLSRLCALTTPLTLNDVALAQTMTNFIQNISGHQENDPYCAKVLKQLNGDQHDPLSEFVVQEGKLYKKYEGSQLLVLPEHIQNEVILVFHELYLHPGVNKTKALVLRHFWGAHLDSNTRQVVGHCRECKSSKISNAKISPSPMHIIASEPGELVSIDIYGPLPMCPGGTMALFVALDILSGFVVTAPLKNMTADSFVGAAKKVIKTFSKSGVSVQKFLSDNARQFRSRKFIEFCSQEGIKKVFTTPYNPQGNPVERVMRDLGEKFRLTFNNPEAKILDHTAWNTHVKKIVFALNNVPKNHGYTPAEILGLEPFAPLRKYKLIPRVRPPLERVKKEISSMVINTKSARPSFSKKRNPQTFSYDCQGYVNVWTDAACKGKGDDRSSGLGYWFSPGHSGNYAAALDPPVKNNKAEVLAVQLAVTHLINNGISKIHVRTDSQYFADLFNENKLSENNQNLTGYENYDVLEFFVGFGDKIKSKGYPDFNLKVSHVPGHSVDFGNLEIDWMVGWTLEKYVDLKKLFDPSLSDLEIMRKFVYISRKYENLKWDHNHTLHNAKTSAYRVGDVVAVRSHPLSAAGYGLTAKFMPRYQGEFKVIDSLSPNTYFLQSMDDPNESTVLANVRQLVLLRKQSTPTDSEEEPQNETLVRNRLRQYLQAAEMAKEIGEPQKLSDLKRGINVLKQTQASLQEGNVLYASDLPPPLQS